MKLWLVLAAVLVAVVAACVGLHATGTLGVWKARAAQALEPERIKAMMNASPVLAFGLVFFGGLLTASNPCVLAMIPLMIGMIGGYQGTGGLKKSLLFSALFVLGLAVMFTILGVIAGTMGKLLGDVGDFWDYFVAAVCVFMGLHLLEVVQINVPVPRGFKPKHGGMVGAFLLGLLFGVVSTPCAVPILAVVLAFIAAKGNIAYGALLLLTYAIGHCVLIVVAGTSIGLAKGIVESKGLTRTTGIMRKCAGALIILVGLWFLFS